MNSDSENIISDENTTDYNNNTDGIEENVNNLVQLNLQNEVESQNNQHYTQLYDDNPNNPFFKCMINKLEYDTDEEENYDYVRIIISWNYEFNYDYFHINFLKCFLSKNQKFLENLNELKKLRNFKNNSNNTGIIEKIKNDSFNLNDTVHIYAIVYYDNAKCNIEFYGIFSQALDEEKLINNIIVEKTYGSKGRVISNLNMTSTGGDEFIVIHQNVNIE